MSPRPGYTKKGYNRQAGWRADAYFAPVSIANPFTYLNDLIDDERPWRTAATAIGRQASNLLTLKELGVGQGSRDDHLRTYSVDDAIQFLTSVANSMRAHEISYITNRINELNNFPGSISKELIDKFNNMANDGFDYISFISLLNEVHGKIILYKRRLDSFKRKDYTRNLERDITGSLSTLISNYTNRRKSFEASQQGIINALTMRFFQTTGAQFIANQIQLGAQGVKNVTAGMALVQRELAQFLSENGDLIYAKINMLDEEFIQQIERLTPKLDQFVEETNIFSALNNQQILDDLINIYGIQIEDKALTVPKSKDAKKARDHLNKILDNLNIDKNISNNNLFNNLFKRVHVNYGSRLLYLHDEIESLITNAVSGSLHAGGLNMATDLLSFTVTIDDEKDKTIVQDMQKEMNNIERYLKESGAENNPAKSTKIYEEQLEKLDKLCTSLEKGFIFHETNKLYTAIEGGNGFKSYGSNSIAAFSGRNMGLLNYIDSMALFGQELGIDTTWLRFVAYNLAGNALGHDLIGPLEKILAIAAGLIMFDDFAQIAKEASGELTYDSIENIHLYKLNGIYVPASYFISATANCLSGIEDLAATDAFQVKITAPGHVDYNREHTKPNPNPSDWAAVKSAASDVDIHLYFGANFLNLINKLQS